MGLRWDTFKAFLRTVINDGQTLRRTGNGFEPVAVPATGEANTFTAAQTFAPTAATSGVRTALTVTQPADTGRTASTEQTSVYINLGATVTWATGALTNQRAVRIAAPTLAFAGASTVTNASTLYINDAPQAGTNATITNAYALWVDAGTTRLDGAVVVGGAVGVGAAASAAAALEVTSTTQGFRPPVMTSTQRDAIASPGEGLVIYNSTTHKLNVRGASAWEEISST